MNTYDTYSSINDNSELRKLSLNLLYAYYYPIITARIMFKGDFHTSEETDLTEPINLQKGVTYDELRHKNRDEFYKKNVQWQAPRTSREPPAARETTKQAPTTDDLSSMQEKTKYGDVWGWNWIRI